MGCRSRSETTVPIGSRYAAMGARSISPREWYRQMREVVRTVQLYSAAAAEGGWAQLTAQDYGRIGARVREQLAYLNGFAADLKTGRQAFDGRATARARLYAQAGRRLFHETESVEMRACGFVYEANILAPADHCGECVTETERGLVPIGTLKPIGTRTCGPNCRCRVRYAKDVDGRAAA